MDCRAEVFSRGHAAASRSLPMPSQTAALASLDAVRRIGVFAVSCESASPARSLTSRVGKDTFAPRHLMSDATRLAFVLGVALRGSLYKHTIIAYYSSRTALVAWCYHNFTVGPILFKTPLARGSMNKERGKNEVKKQT